MKLRQNGVWVDVDTYIRQNGQWNYINFLRDANELLLIISQTTTNLNLQTAFNNTFGTTAWTSTRRKRVVINPGVVVGATNTANYALNIPSGLGGSLAVDNYGSILGAGGASNSGTGGNAVFAGSIVTFNNQGTIYAGGGGGGQGGTGGSGSVTVTVVNQLGYSGIRGTSVPGCNQTSWLEGCAQACRQRFGNSIGGSTVYASTPCGYTVIGQDSCNPVCKYGGCGGIGGFNVTSSESWTCAYNTSSTSPTVGGSGGSGGRGQGYNQSPTNGIPGSAGGTNAGTGGTGGNGGGWGTSGTNGTAGSNGTVTAGSAGSSGGLAGFYVVNNGNITWINTGVVAGRVI